MHARQQEEGAAREDEEVQYRMADEHVVDGETALISCLEKAHKGFH